MSVLKKIRGKIIFTAKLLSIGSGLRSKMTLLWILARLSYAVYRRTGRAYAFTCRVRAGTRSTVMRFTGAMSEIMTLVDIFVDDNYLPRHNHEQALFGKRLPTLLDLGANIGLASVWFALKYPHIRIDAYEPNSALCMLLRENMAAFPQAQVYEEAIAGTEGTVAFYQSVHTLESSVFSAPESTVIRVPAVTLDTAIDRIGGSVDLIKLDIEGAEFDALAGCSKLASVRSIIGEGHPEQAGRTQGELEALLSPFETAEIYNPNLDSVFGFYASRLSRAETP